MKYHAQLREFTAHIDRIISENPGGFTIDSLGAFVYPRKGYAVAVAPLRNSEVAAIALKEVSAEFVGGWKNTVGDFFLDSVRIIDSLPAALALARETNQEAIYDFANSCEIVTIYNPAGGKN